MIRQSKLCMSWRRRNYETEKEQLIITFRTTTEAMRMEKFCMANGVKGRLIPLPEAISAGCGLVWKTEPEEKESLVEILLREGIRWEEMQVIYI